MSPRNKPITGDEESRELIRHSLDESLLVEAAAGTGKTSELVQRIVAVLREDRTTIDRVVAVTFTRKAAGELKIRLRQELDLSRQRASAAAGARHLEEAMAHFEEARIGTIHSFCAELLRERPVEARVDPAFQELSEDEAPRVFDRAFRRWIEEKLADPPPGLRRALSRAITQRDAEEGSPLDRIRDAAWNLAEWRDFPASWRRNTFEREDIIDGLVRWVQELATLSQRCLNQRDELYQALRPARDVVTWIERAERERARDHDQLEGILIQLGKNLKRDKRKGGGTFAEGLPRQEVTSAREKLLDALEEFRRQADADLAALLQGELRELVQRYEEQKQSVGALDFVDLLLRARDLIRGNLSIRGYFQQRFSHLFIDEFQDTDPLQAEILLLLSADDAQQNDWRRVHPVSGKLFVVGDPKQSIYRFRRADVLLYQEIKQTLLAAGVRLAHLSRSFRAVRPIQQLVNAAFETEMNGDPGSGQPEYVPLQEFRPPTSGQASVIVLPVPRPYGKERVANTAIDASLPDAVAAFLQWLIQERGWKVGNPENPGRLLPLSPRDVCILFRRFVSYGKDVTRDYTRALEARGIPHVLVGARSFHHREEVETLRAALTAVEWPDDELSVFATLRGSLFAIPDHVLFRFRHEAGKLHPFRKCPEHLEPDLQPVKEALGTLATLHRSRNQRSLVESIGELLAVTRAHAGFALRPSGQQVLVNVQRLMDLGRRFELGGGISFRGFVELLEQEAEKPNSNESPTIEESFEGIRLMTVHGAKGLEFPVVVLADLTCKLAHTEPDKFVDSHQGLAAMKLLGYTPWDLLDHAAEEQKRDVAEGVRVAYVAATRARDLLVVPAVGDVAHEGWIQPLNKAIYPPRKKQREAERAPGCPEFGDETVLDRPPVSMLPSSVKPGLHRGECGACEVVWWDPSVLDLDVPMNFGLREQQILAEDETGETTRAGLVQYRAWKDQRSQWIERASEPAFEVLAVTRTLLRRPPPTSSLIQVEPLAKEKNRPVGPRFGTLVHTILRDVALQGDKNAIAGLANSHARVLGAPEEEVQAATRAVSAALNHSLIRRAASAARLHREFPLLLKLGDKQLIEGTIDLAFVENGHWILIDFKTDLNNKTQPDYLRQAEWYAYGLSQVMKSEVQGWLLGV
jgi:ATP-dependent exoDNAse (exonuclease V) beta subunit